MHEYRVIERWADDGLCALRVMPPEKACLHGAKGRLGFGILLCTESGAIFRVIFESIDEPQPVPVPVPASMHSWTSNLRRPSFAVAESDD